MAGRRLGLRLAVKSVALRHSGSPAHALSYFPIRFRAFGALMKGVSSGALKPS